MISTELQQAEYTDIQDVRAEHNPAPNTTLSYEPKVSVIVLWIPIEGGNGNIQNRSVVFKESPTKEKTLEVLNRLHLASEARGAGYNGDWLRCVKCVQQVPEQLFARLNQNRARSFTHLVSVNKSDGTSHKRIFTARECQVH